MPNKEQRKQLAEATLEVMETGILPLGDDMRLDISSLIVESVNGTCSYSESAPLPKPIPKEKGIQTSFSVVNTTTLDAARALYMENLNDDESNHSCEPDISNDKKTGNENLSSKEKSTTNKQVVAVLNFASAKNPGGGFLRGAMAQEESLALHSGMYACLKGDKMYDFHRKLRGGVYTDWTIFSPNVPVFRDEKDGELAEPWPCSIITCPCINLTQAGLGKKQQNTKKKKASTKNQKAEENKQKSEVRELQQMNIRLRKRAKRMLRVLAAHHQGPIVLGAWGCGVFGNDPHTIARIFMDLLSKDELFVNRWPTVVFAVLDPYPPHKTFQAFETVFRTNTVL